MHRAMFSAGTILSAAFEGACDPVEGASDPVVGVWTTSCENDADDVNDLCENAGLIDREATVATRDAAKPLESNDRLCENILGAAIMTALYAGK
jgi:hypothetical protein